MRRDATRSGLPHFKLHIPFTMFALPHNVAFNEFTCNFTCNSVSWGVLSDCRALFLSISVCLATLKNMSMALCMPLAELLQLQLLMQHTHTHTATLLKQLCRHFKQLVIVLSSSASAAALPPVWVAITSPFQWWAGGRGSGRGCHRRRLVIDICILCRVWYLPTTFVWPQRLFSLSVCPSRCPSVCPSLCLSVCLSGFGLT